MHSKNLNSYTLLANSCAFWYFWLRSVSLPCLTLFVAPFREHCSSLWMTSSAACCALGQWSHQLSNISSTSWMSKRWNTTMWMRRLSISGRRIGKTTGRLRTLMITLRVPFCMLYVSMWMYSKYQKYKSICFRPHSMKSISPHDSLRISIRQ